MSNPFIEKAREKTAREEAAREQARATLNNHVKEIHNLLKRIDKKNEAQLHARVEARLNEARDAARKRA